MTSTESVLHNVLHRRPFASRFAHRGWGMTLVIAGGLFALSSFTNILAGIGVAAAGLGGTAAAQESAPAGIVIAVFGVFTLLVNLAMVTWGVYLLRGRGESPRAVRRRETAERRRAEDQQRRDEAARVRAERAGHEISVAVAALAVATGGAAVVAYREVRATARRWYPQEADAMVAEAIEAEGIDLSPLDAPRLGLIFSRDGRNSIEVYRDWIIRGTDAHDVDAFTQGHVHVDGSIQVSSTRDSSNRVVEKRHDMRTAELQFIGSGWSISEKINPDHAIDARKLVAELSAHIETLKSRGLTQDDLKGMVETILNNTGQPPAEKLKQLSNLRFDRLLSDDEYEQAKAKILGLN